MAMATPLGVWIQSERRSRQGLASCPSFLRTPSLTLLPRRIADDCRPCHASTANGMQVLGLSKTAAACWCCHGSEGLAPDSYQAHSCLVSLWPALVLRDQLCVEKHRFASDGEPRPRRLSPQRERQAKRPDISPRFAPSNSPSRARHNSLAGVIPSMIPAVFSTQSQQ